MARSRRARVLGLLTITVGIVVAFSPLGPAGEDLALYALFTLRGPIDPPPEVVVVSMRGTPGTKLGHKRDRAELPRSTYADLIDQLVSQGTSSIVLDVAFDEPSSPDEDASLAEAIARSQRVVLFQYVHRESVEMGEITKIVSPIPELADAALGLAPHILPKVPSRLSQSWAFMPAVGEAPTLPVVALQAHAFPFQDRFVGIMKEVGIGAIGQPLQNCEGVSSAADPCRMMRFLRHAFKKDPHLAKLVLSAITNDQGLSSEQKQILAALVKVCRGNDSYYLNFYGPAGTIPTIPYQQVLRYDESGTNRLDLAGKVVFIGMSVLDSAEQVDSYPTVYSRSDGVDLSGVEIAATAFGNLLTDRTIRPASLWLTLGILLTFGVLAAVLGSLHSETGRVAATLALGALYFCSALILFEKQDLWLPLFVPLGVQLPLGLLAAMFSQSVAAKRVTAYFLPEKLATQLENGVAPEAATELVYGTCLATDAERYTTLSETLEPGDLATLMNEYFSELGNPVLRHRGEISEVTADSMMCTWSAPHDDKKSRLRACLASLEIGAAVDQFNRKHEGQVLPTRVGLHTGQMVLGNVGAGGHYTYQVVGDVANTASRIQGLSKHLGTSILASEAVVDGLDELLLRRVGLFKLVGKARALTIIEILGLRQDAGPNEWKRREAFAPALNSFDAGQWAQATAQFETIVTSDPSDGPARFYLKLCQVYLASPPSGAAQVIELDTK